MSEPSTKEIQEFVDRQAIHQVMMRYCHGVDRCDVEMLKTSFWEDGACLYGGQESNAMDWSEGTVAALSTMVRTFHSVSNYLIDLDGDTATSETYCTAYHQLRGEDGSLTDMIVGGRYLDRHEKRNGEWRIAYRHYVHDWNTNNPSTEHGPGEMMDAYDRGERAPTDLYYSMKK